MYAMCPDRHACRSWFENKVEKHRSALRCLNYPDQVPAAYSAPDALLPSELKPRGHSLRLKLRLVTLSASVHMRFDLL